MIHRLRLGRCLPAGMLAGCLLLAGCAASPRSAPVPELRTLPASAPHTQHLVFEHDGERHELLAVLSHDQRVLRMALLSPQGQRLLTLEQDAKGARFLPGAAFDPPFSAQWLAERLSWSLWPVEQLARAFRGSSWSVQQHPQGHDIYYRKQLVASIIDTGHCHVVDDVQAGYRLYRTPVQPNASHDELPCPSP